VLSSGAEIDISPSEYLERKNENHKGILVGIAGGYLVFWRFLRIRHLLPFSTLMRGKDGPPLASALVDEGFGLDLHQYTIQQYTVCRRMGDGGDLDIIMFGEESGGQNMKG